MEKSLPNFADFSSLATYDCRLESSGQCLHARASGTLTRMVLVAPKFRNPAVPFNTFCAKKRTLLAKPLQILPFFELFIDPRALP